MPGIKLIKVEIVTVSENDDAHSLRIEGKKINDIVKSANTVSKRWEIDNKVVFHTHTDTKYNLSNLKKLDYIDEILFHNQPCFCIIDGSSYCKYREEILTVRGHHYPESPWLPKFCIINPIVCAKNIDSSIRNDDEAFAFLEKTDFRCHLVKPTQNGLFNALQTLRLYYEGLDEMILNRIFNGGTT